MATTMIRGKSQIKANTIDVGRLEADFTAGSDWNHSNGNNDAVLTGGTDPVNPNDYTIKQYVDNLVNGVSWHDPARVMSEDNVAISGLLTIDGVTLVDGDRVLLDGQTDPIENGVWIAHAGAWTRPTDWAVGDEVASAALFVEEGTVNADTAWVVTNDSGSDVVGTDGMDLVKFANISGSSSNRIFGEEPAVTHNSALLGQLANFPVLVGTERVYMNGVRQREGVGNDYTIVLATGFIIFNFNLQAPGPAAANDVVVVDYEY